MAPGTFVATLFVAGLLTAGPMSVQGAPAERPTDDQGAVGQIIADQVTAWNRGDAAAYAKAVRQDCVFTNTAA